ncbi:MAG: IPT/TIG domain-containing protein [Dehalococcoidia bacterium]
MQHFRHGALIALAAFAVMLIAGWMPTASANAQVGEGQLIVKKIGAPATSAFNIEVHEAGNLDNVITNIVVAGGASSSATLDGGAYTLSELESQNYVVAGWALADASGNCPGAPTNTDQLYTVAVTPGEFTTVCLFNTGESPSMGHLVVNAVDGQGSQSFNIEVHEAGNLDQVVTNIVVPGSSQSSAVLESGSYTVSELEVQDYVLQGWALAEGSTSCPAQPTSTTGLFSFTVNSGEDTTLCVYHESGQTSAAPVINSVSPAMGNVSGGLAVGISGDNLAGANSVRFGTVSTQFSVVDDSTIVAVAPPHAAGTVSISVSTPDGTTQNSAVDNFTYSVMSCPETPLWVNEANYGSAGGGFYWDPASGQVWTAERGWHYYDPQPSHATKPLWVNALTYGSAGGGFYWDPSTQLVWTAERDWHVYAPVDCLPSNALQYAQTTFQAWLDKDGDLLSALTRSGVTDILESLRPADANEWSFTQCNAGTGQVACTFSSPFGASLQLLIDNQMAAKSEPGAVMDARFN